MKILIEDFGTDHIYAEDGAPKTFADLSFILVAISWRRSSCWGWTSISQPPSTTLTEEWRGKCPVCKTAATTLLRIF